MIQSLCKTKKPEPEAIVSLAAPAALRGRIYSFFLAGFDGGMTLGGAGVQPLIQVLPLSTIFALLGGTGCGVSLFAFRRFAGIGKVGDRLRVRFALDKKAGNKKAGRDFKVVAKGFCAEKSGIPVKSLYQKRHIKAFLFSL